MRWKELGSLRRVGDEVFCRRVEMSVESADGEDERRDDARE